ncbi:MAG: alanine--tRNA ligase [Flavobacteriales bacterium]|nr:alanine--tRNA ligase [Flavobacteriales bacterium]
MEWTTNKVRATFLEYFRGHGHAVVDSAPIVIKDDPTLMFTNAGMNQFKSIFVGNEDAAQKRIVDTQKCLRVSGKHNDLEEVGRDHYHHTMFEMLGNWSFGDYFKKEAIELAWDLLINVYGIDKGRVYVTVFGGDDELGLGLDEEARDLWKLHIEEDRILPFGRKDNFWEMGETGPCGPCSEIHVDLRSDEERSKVDGRSLVNQDDPSVIEIWNLVFMQFNRLENGDLKTLKEKHIDTGMGLERLVRVLQGVDSNYEIDLFQTLIASIAKETSVAYGGTAELPDVAFRVIADHIRAIAFCIADGQLPSNNGAGYVVRRVLRRAIRYGFSQLNMKKPFIYSIAGTLVDEMGVEFSELTRGKELIQKVIKEEESTFLSTLEKGLDRLSTLFESESGIVVEGPVAFELYDTFGFPIDLTNLIAEERGWKVDMEGFNKELLEQKERSRNAGKTSFGDWTILQEGPNSLFLGYEQLQSSSVMSKYRLATLKGKESAQIVLKETPFYAESGGQVGDKGTLTIGGQELNVFDTKKENNEIIHFIERLPNDVNGEVAAQVDPSLRGETLKNHSATHLLHLALRNTLGTHVEQKGSLVAPDRLRFDFSHFEKVTDEQLQAIERQVREMIAMDLIADIREMSIAEAKELGAMALFGEKYGDRVRVVQFGLSIELCGGTHVPRSSEIGGFKLLSESSIASGIRRVEALTGRAYQTYVDDRMAQLEAIEAELGHPKDSVASVAKLQSDLKKANKLLEELADREKGQLKKDLTAKVARSGGISAVTSLVMGIEGKAVKDAVYGLTLEHNDLLAIVVGEFDEKPYIVVGVSKELVNTAGMDASKLIRELAVHIDGGGGGQKFLAMAGGKNKEGLRRALAHADDIVKDQAI